MGISQAVPVAIGLCAVSSELALLTFDIIFAVFLDQHDSSTRFEIAAVVASALSGASIGLLSTLLARQIRYRKTTHIEHSGHARHTYLLAGFTGVFTTLGAIASAVAFAGMRSETVDLPRTIMMSPTSNMLAGAFVIWGVSLLLTVAYVIYMVIIQRKDFQRQIRPYQAEPEHQMFPRFQEKSLSRSPSAQGTIEYQRGVSEESKSPPSSSGRPRSPSASMSSIRSSFSQAVRPITSKSKLVPHSQRSSHRPSSRGSSQYGASVEEGFDSWDTSSVDSSARQAVESASPTPQRFLETIPASPTTSRSASPGFPLDLEPPRIRQRDRSYSPANSYRARSRSATTSPIESPNEAHIHPLFRTDSPTPPPPATPGTVVTAAPNAGQLITDQSVRRMRSGSLNLSPLSHSNSFESIPNTTDKGELDVLQEETGERTLTPPIPDFIMNGGPKRSLSGYNLRKQAQDGLGIQGVQAE